MTVKEFTEAVQHGRNSKMVMINVAIYKHPSDYPNNCVARVHFISKGKVWASKDIFVVCDTVDECRDALPPGMRRMPRSPQDCASLVETYL